MKAALPPRVNNLSNPPKWAGLHLIKAYFASDFIYGLIPPICIREKISEPKSIANSTLQQSVAGLEVGLRVDLSTTGYVFPMRICIVLISNRKDE